MSSFHVPRFSYPSQKSSIQSHKVKDFISSIIIVASSTLTIPQYTDVKAIEPPIQSDAIDYRRVMAKLPSQEAQSSASTITLPSGVQYFDVINGNGNLEVKEGTTVQFNWILRRSNGYFVDSSTLSNNEPFIYKVGNTKKVIRGLDEAIRGMRAGGVRRVNVPPKLAFVEGVEAGMPGPLPQDFGPKRQILTRMDRETWFFEIQMIKVK